MEEQGPSWSISFSSPALAGLDMRNADCRQRRCPALSKRPSVERGIPYVPDSADLPEQFCEPRPSLEEPK